MDTLKEVKKTISADTKAAIKLRDKNKTTRRTVATKVVISGVLVYSLVEIYKRTEFNSVLNRLLKDSI